jgi:hypothetical protein
MSDTLKIITESAPSGMSSYVLCIQTDDGYNCALSYEGELLKEPAFNLDSAAEALLAAVGAKLGDVRSLVADMRDRLPIDDPLAQRARVWLDATGQREQS